MPWPETPKSGATVKKNTARQTCITDTFKERKRKNVEPIDKTQSKEKRKRETAIIENFKSLKDSFLSASKNIKRNLHLSNQDDKVLTNNATDINKVSYNIDAVNNVPTVSSKAEIETLNLVPDQNDCTEDIDGYDFIDDEKIDNLLSEIESEMCKHKGSSAIATTSVNNSSLYSGQQSLNFPKLTREARKRKPFTTKSNYTFIDVIKKKSSIIDEENDTGTSHEDNGFSDTIKAHIQKYLTKTKKVAKPPDGKLEILFNSEGNNENVSISKQQECLQEKQLADEIPASPTFDLYPKYEIKEILGTNDCVGRCNAMVNIQRNQNEELITCKDTQNVNNESKTHMFIADELNEKCNKNSTLPVNNSKTAIGYESASVTAAEDMMLVSLPLVHDNSEMDFSVLSRDNPPKAENSTDDTAVNLLNRNISNLHLSIPNIIDCDENNSSKQLVCIPKEPSNEDQRSKMQENYSNAMSLMPIDNKLLTCIPLKNKDDCEILKFKNFNDCSDDRHNEFMQNNMLIIDADVRKTHNQVLTNRNSCLDTKGIKLPSWNVIDESLNDITKINKFEPKPEYVKKYCYSTTKVDTCTNQTSEYSVKVIKRVRLDMDVTEIVTRKRNPSFDKNINFDSEEKHKNNIIIFDPEVHEETNIQNKSRNLGKHETQSAWNPSGSKHGFLLARKDQIKVENNQITADDHDGVCNLPEIPFTMGNQEMINLDERQNTKTLFSEPVRISDNNEEKDTLDAPTVHENSVDKILQKYGRILGYVSFSMIF